MDAIGSRQKPSKRACAPHFGQRLVDVRATLGETLTLECRVDGYPRPEIHWEKDHKLLGKSRNIHTTRCGEKCILELRCVKESDLGLYRCVAVNIIGNAKTQSRILLLDCSTTITSQQNATQTLVVPRSSSIRSRSTERQSPRCIPRSPSTPGRIKDYENYIQSTRKQNVMEKTQSKVTSKAADDKANKTHTPNKFTSTFANRIRVNIPSIFRSNFTVDHQENANRRQSTIKASKNGCEPLTTSKNRSQTTSKILVSSSSLKSPIPSRKLNQSEKVANGATFKNSFSTAVQCPVKFLREVGQKICKPSESRKTSVTKSEDPRLSFSSTSPSEKQNDFKEKTSQTIRKKSVSEKAPIESELSHVVVAADSSPPTITHGQEIEVSSEGADCDSGFLEISLRERLLTDNPEVLDNAEVLHNGKNESSSDPSELPLDSEGTLRQQLLPQITIHNTENEDEFESLFKTCTCTCHGSSLSSTDESLSGNVRYSRVMPDEDYEELLRKKPVPDFHLPNGSDGQVTTDDGIQRPIHVSEFTSPSRIIKGPVSTTVKSGDEVILSVDFIGTPPNTVTWMRGGTILANGGQYSINMADFTSELRIRSVTADDSGKYIATVENDFGGDSCFASMAVMGFPKPPGGPPTASDFTPHSLVLSWYGSMFDGGSVLTGYVVEMCEVPGRQWQTVATCVDTSCVVDGLSLGQRYLFRVRARNRYGQSEPSRETQTIYLDDYLSAQSDDNDDVPNNPVTIQLFAEFMERYDLKEEVGRGKFGKVHRCVDKWTGYPRAAKMIRCRKAKDRTDVRREIEVMKKLRHPKLLRIVGAFESDKMVVMVTEYISGGELFQRVIMDDFVLTESDCILFMRQICDAVSYMHRCSVLHLDLKPENILCKTRTSHQIKIIDFGLSAFYNPNEKLCILFGTPEFVAPEVIAFEPVGPPSDMWSVGVICYVLLSGLSPFLGDSESETFANITRGDIDFDEEEFDNISEDAKKFISEIVVKNPRRRLTAEECLNHTWLKRAYWLEDYPPLSTEKLKKFIIRRKWQKSGTAIRALRRFVTLSRSSAESFGESESSLSLNPASPTPTDTSEDSGVFQELNSFDFSK